MCGIFFLHFKDEEFCKQRLQCRAVINKTTELEPLNLDAMPREV